MKLKTVPQLLPALGSTYFIGGWNYCSYVTTSFIVPRFRRPTYYIFIIIFFIIRLIYSNSTRIVHLSLSLLFCIALCMYSVYSMCVVVCLLFQLWFLSPLTFRFVPGLPHLQSSHTYFESNFRRTKGFIVTPGKIQGKLTFAHLTFSPPFFELQTQRL